MKRSQLILATVALPLDYTMLVLAGVAAYQIRFVPWVRAVRPVIFQLPLSEFVPMLIIMAAVWLLLFAIAGLYQIGNYLKLTKEIGRLFLACTAGLALIVVLFFFNPQFFSSRFIVLVGWMCAFLFTAVGRLSLRWLRVTLYRRGVATSRVLLIGADMTTLALERLFAASPGLGFKVVRRVAECDIDSLGSLCAGVDEVVVGDPALPRNVTLSIREFCANHHYNFKYAADMLEAQSHNVVIHTLAGVPLVEIRRTPLDGWGRVLKRLFDVMVSLCLLILLSPLLFLLAVLVLADSGWPAFVGLIRIGEEGSIFKLYKFRSMVRNAEALKNQLLVHNERAGGPLFKMSNDPRVTRVGRWLRRSSLDELPQLVNVLLGNMSLVGPRPHEPNEVARYEQHQRKLLNLKPGITGLAQISGRSELTFDDEAKLDTFYVENWSLGADFVILIKTLVVVLQRRAAV